MHFFLQNQQLFIRGNKKRNYGIDSNTLLLVQVDKNGNIVERTGNGTITTTGTVIVDHTTTHDGFGSIRNTASSTSTIWSGSFYVNSQDSLNNPIPIGNNFTVEGWCYRLDDGGYAEFLYFGLVNNPSMRVINWHPTYTENEYTEAYFMGTYSGGSILTRSREWFHFALVVTLLYTGNYLLKFYINGELSSSVEIVGVTYVNLPRMFVGRSGNNSVKNTYCIENIRVSNIARYTANFTPPDRYFS